MTSIAQENISDNESWRNNWVLVSITHDTHTLKSHFLGKTHNRNLTYKVKNNIQNIQIKNLSISQKFTIPLTQPLTLFPMSLFFSYSLGVNIIRLLKTSTCTQHKFSMKWPWPCIGSCHQSLTTAPYYNISCFVHPWENITTFSIKHYKMIDFSLKLSIFLPLV